MSGWGHWFDPRIMLFFSSFSFFFFLLLFTLHRRTRTHLPTEITNRGSAKRTQLPKKKTYPLKTVVPTLLKNRGPGEFDLLHGHPYYIVMLPFWMRQLIYKYVLNINYEETYFRFICPLAQIICSKSRTRRRGSWQLRFAFHRFTFHRIHR